MQRKMLHESIGILPGTKEKSTSGRAIVQDLKMPFVFILFVFLICVWFIICFVWFGFGVFFCIVIVRLLNQPPGLALCMSDQT